MLFGLALGVAEQVTCHTKKKVIACASVAHNLGRAAAIAAQSGTRVLGVNGLCVHFDVTGSA